MDQMFLVSGGGFHQYQVVYENSPANKDDQLQRWATYSRCIMLDSQIDIYQRGSVFTC